MRSRLTKPIIHFEERRALRMKEFCTCYGVGRSSAYALIRAGKLPDVKIAGMRVIPCAAAEALLKPEEIA
jgi:Helix-turn-helix domain